MEVVEKMFCEHFKKNFTTTMPSQEQMDAAISDLPAKIIGEMANYLEQPFTAEEIVEALAQMCPTKVPSPNGLHVTFFQKH